jgi:hypothetical protein
METREDCLAKLAEMLEEFDIDSLRVQRDYYARHLLKDFEAVAQEILDRKVAADVGVKDPVVLPPLRLSF